MDPATFKTIISIQKKEMKDVGEEKKKMTGVGTKRDNQEWASFFVAAKKSSRKKKKKSWLQNGRKRILKNGKFRNGFDFTISDMIRTRTT